MNAADAMHCREAQWVYCKANGLDIWQTKLSAHEVEGCNKGITARFEKDASSVDMFSRKWMDYLVKELYGEKLR